MASILPPRRAESAWTTHADYGLKVAIYGFRRRVACYVTRTTDGGEELLVIEHTGGEPGDSPVTQVPAGTMMPFESLADAALREVGEETGLSGLSYVDQVGATELGLDDAGGPSLTNFVHVVAAAAGVPDAAGTQEWEHTVTGAGEDAGMVFRCRWEPLPLNIELAADQDAFLDRLGS
jgi:8-oxo-dGTP pyrophosphatase MutT (NUDIX family)